VMPWMMPKTTAWRMSMKALLLLWVASGQVLLREGLKFAIQYGFARSANQIQ